MPHIIKECIQLIQSLYYICSQKELAFYAISHWWNNNWPVADNQNKFSTEKHLSESKACI